MPERVPSFHSRLDEGIDNIEVFHTGPDLEAQNAADLVASFYVSTWGDGRLPSQFHEHESWRLAQLLADGKALPNALESVSMTFSFSGISRATTHQLVRTRVGAGFGQQGGRDNDWSNFNLRLPSTFSILDDGYMNRIARLQNEMNNLYQAMLINGVPTQDARYILPMGLETALVGTYNLLALKGTLQRRLCNRMMWETNYVARRMADLAVEAFPWFGQNLRASCVTRSACSSVSDLFPPADLIPQAYGFDGGDPDIIYAKDHPTLAEALGSADETYSYPKEVNGCYILFDEIDRARAVVEREWKGRGTEVVTSHLDATNILTYKDDDGLWRKHNG